jgi:uncharacterized protein (TIGR02594 family)
MSPDEYQTILAQIHLKAAGHYSGRIDGVWGPLSTMASKAWFTDLDKSTLPNPFLGTLRALAAQHELSHLNLYCGHLDGFWGSQSRAAALEARAMDIGSAQPAQPVPDTRHHTLPYDIAKNYLGVREIPGKDNHPKIIQWLRRLAAWVTSEETSWCSAFVDFCAIEAGFEATGSLAARSWLKVGDPIPLDQARKGDVVILWRVSRTSWEGHVAFLDHYNAKRGLLYLLGGNQNNAVNIIAYPVDRLLGVRRLRSLDKLQGPARTV